MRICISTLFWVTAERRCDVKKGRRTHPFDGGASLLLPLVAAQLQGAVDVGFSVVGAQDEQSAGTWRNGELLHRETPTRSRPGASVS